MKNKDWSSSDAALGKNQESLTKFIDNLDDGFELLEIISNNQGNIIDFVFLKVNSAYQQLTGLKATDIIGRRKKEVAPAAEERWYDYAIQAVKTGRTSSYQYFNVKVNAYYETRFIPIPPNQIAVLFKDITERKKTEEALRQSEERFSKAFEEGPAALVISRLEDGLVIDVNESFLELFEFNRSEVINHRTDELNIYPNPKAREELVRRLNKQGIIRNLELGMKTGKGKHIRVLASIDKIALDTQQYIISTLIDISERKKAEETLKQSEQRYRELYESFDEAFIVTDWEFNVIHWNKAAERVTSVPEKEALGKKVYDVLPEMLAVDVNPYFEALKEKKPARFMMNVVSRETKKPSVFEISTYPSALGITVIVEDKTEEEETKRLSAIGATAGMVGHDIRNPLQAMISDVFLMKDELESVPVCKGKDGIAESLTDLEQNINYVNKIVADLQDFARAIKPEYCVINMSEIFIRIFSIIRVPDEIILSIKIRDLENLTTDPLLVQRALSNVVNNAIQAMPNGGNLEIAGYPKENKVIITVSDTGQGIPDEVKPKLFTPMMTTKSKGQGFGLAVSKRIIEALQGTISFESDVGKGTKFTIELPLPTNSK